MGHRHTAAEGRDVDDAAVAGARELGEGGEAKAERAPEVDRHLALEVLQAHVGDRARGDQAGVVHQDVEAPEAAHRRAHDDLRVRGDGDVTLESEAEEGRGAGKGAGPTEDLVAAVRRGAARGTGLGKRLHGQDLQYFQVNGKDFKESGSRLCRGRHAARFRRK